MDHIHRYTKYIFEAVREMDIDAATYKDHLHKVFEWYGCIQLTHETGRPMLRWEDVPADLREEHNMRRDMGIDAWDIEGDCVVQMKLYSDTIGWKDFCTFLGAVTYGFENSTKILYRNAESNICNMIRGLIKNNKLQDITVADAVFRQRCKEIQAITYPAELIEESTVIRPYQVEAEQMIERAKLEEKNLGICIPTGTGKTAITLSYHGKHREETMLILVPTIVLMEQWADACAKRGFTAYLIGTGKYHDMDAYKGETIVVCVYDSFANIHGEAGRFYRMVVDEAHHVLTPERYREHEEVDEEDDDEDEEHEGADEEDEEGDDEDEAIAAQAAPVRNLSYMARIRTLRSTGRMIYLSATIDRLGEDELFYEYKVRQAITDGYLCDYQYVIPHFTNKNVTNQQLAHYLVRHQQESHCLIYAPTCKEGKEFTTLLNAIEPRCAGYVDGYTPIKERKRIFEAFEKGTIRFLVNIRVLVEGYDAPHIRSIFFLHISSNDLFIIQAIGRALRLHKDKIHATIYVPFTQEEDSHRIRMFVRQLYTYDERIATSIQDKRIGGYLDIVRGDDQEPSDVLCNTKKDEDAQEISEFLYNIIMDRTGHNEGFDDQDLKNAQQCKAFYEEYGRMPKQCKDRTSDEHRLAVFFGRMKMYKQKGTYRVSSAVDKLFTDLLGDKWYANAHMMLAIQKAKVYVQWMKENKRQPTFSASVEGERDHAVWFKNFRGNNHQYPEVVSILTGYLGPDWNKEVDREAKILKQAHEYITWYHANGRHASQVVKDKKKDITEAHIVEHNFALWYTDMKRCKTLKKGNEYASVETLMSTTFGADWYKKRDLEAIAIENAKEYVAFFKVNKHTPRSIYKPKNQEDIRETQLYTFVSRLKSGKSGKGTSKLYPSVEKILKEGIGVNWFENKDLEQAALDGARKYIEWYQAQGRHPKDINKPKTQEEIIESDMASFMARTKQAKKGNVSSIYYPSVGELFRGEFGDNWDSNMDRAAIALKKAQDYFAWYDTHAKYPRRKNKSETGEITAERKEEIALDTWFQNFKKYKRAAPDTVVYPAVEALVVQRLGANWHA
jgi:superfamily II DNA or RNA helicase